MKKSLVEKLTSTPLAPLGDWLVGDSKYAKIEGATLVELPDASDKDLGGHDVDEQVDIIESIKQGKAGYVGTKSSPPPTPPKQTQPAPKKKSSN